MSCVKNMSFVFVEKKCLMRLYFVKLRIPVFIQSLVEAYLLHFVQIESIDVYTHHQTSIDKTFADDNGRTSAANGAVILT